MLPLAGQYSLGHLPIMMRMHFSAAAFKCGHPKASFGAVDLRAIHVIPRCAAYDVARGHADGAAAAQYAVKSVSTLFWNSLARSSSRHDADIAATDAAAATSAGIEFSAAEQQ